MDAILQAACPINAKPIGHPNTPGASPSIRDFTLHRERAYPRGVVHARRGDKAIDQLIALVYIHMLFGNIHEDIFRSAIRRRGDLLLSRRIDWDSSIVHDLHCDL